MTETETLASLAATRVVDLDGRLVRLRDPLASGITVLVLLRQFGCLFCHELVSELGAASADITARGARLVLVGCGTAEQARRFDEAKGLTARGIALYTDPDGAAYRAAETSRSYARTFFDAGARHAYARARASGHRITGVQGDVPQLGAVFVVRPPAEAVYAHRSRFAGDHPELDALFAAVTSARPSSRPAAA